MSGRPVCLYDANVLYSAQLRDFLMRLVLGGALRAHWTEQIHEEWMRNVEVDYPDITWEELRRVRSLMDEALPRAEVTGYEGRIEDLSLPDPNDRHVLAAAIHAGADHIVTFNIRDFPSSKLESWDIEATGIGELVSGLFGQMPGRIIDVARRHRQSLTRPSKSPEEYLQLLRGCRLEETARLLRNPLMKEHQGRI
ncbi:PIN domain-containing protein [Salinibacter ruber]|uniref:PIN domain-containing protein n=1 Tax=Salinibacter ruber TaxID=146919 RepID=UPI00207314A7|nr:PIN domain-containing protein [Salinibacter ruber]